jgi:hypothetical protein
MQVSFSSGANGFTLDRMSGVGGEIESGAGNITISRSRFDSALQITGSIAHVVLDQDHFDWEAISTPTSPGAKIFIDVDGTLSEPALTIRDSSFRNGDFDGVHVGGGSGIEIIRNDFANLCDRHVNHTDNVQLQSGTQIRIADNYVHESRSCPTQGITSYDGGTDRVIIEDNVVDVPRDWGIELYSDRDSIVRHNTVVYHPAAYSAFGTGTGKIHIDRKPDDPAGTGTRVFDNIASVDFASGSSGTADHNVSGEGMQYAGPLTSWAGFRLSPRSPVGVHAASDGLDDGARISTPAR